LNRNRYGTEKGIQGITIDQLREYHARHFHPTGMIIAIAGDFQWESIQEHIRLLFGDWDPNDRIIPEIQNRGSGSIHLSKELEQTQIALAFPSVPASSADFYRARGLISILSQDMSSRLFMNVREKYGLCYAIYATHETLKDRGTIIAYAGAKPELAQETLDRLVHEIRALSDGILDEELDRVKVGLKSSLIMRQESTSARASGLASDWFLLGRVRTIEEIQQKIEGLTVGGLLNHVEQYPFRNATLVTLGVNSLTLTEAGR
jgi:predicted Zn-dependent peptidase